MGKMNLKEEDIYLKKVCPFVENPPSKDCHVTKTSSLSMMAAMKYCGRYYEECGIYISELPV